MDKTKKDSFIKLFESQGEETVRYRLAMGELLSEAGLAAVWLESKEEERRLKEIVKVDKQQIETIRISRWAMYAAVVAAITSFIAATPIIIGFIRFIFG